MDGDPGQGPPPPNSSSGNSPDGDKKDAVASVGPKKRAEPTSSVRSAGVSLEFGSDEIVRAAVDREGDSSSKQQRQGRRPAATAPAVAQKEAGEVCRTGCCVQLIEPA